MALKSILFLTFFVRHIISQEWEPPYLLANEAEKDRVKLDDKLIYMDENIKDIITVAYLNYNGDQEPKITEFLAPEDYDGFEILGPAFHQTGSDQNWGLDITKPQDYENRDVGIKFMFEITAAGTSEIISVFIRNIDDERPYIQVVKNPCEIKENSIEVSDCLYIVTDEDGIVDNMTYSVSGSEGINSIFEFVNEKPLTTGMREWNVFLKTLKPLDFESIALYLFDFTVTDSGNNTSTAKIVVEVIDLPDVPPVWKVIFSSKQFDEKTEQTFQVIAVDGDINVNDTINYEIQAQPQDDFFSIEQETGVIHISKIDRDALQQEIFTFMIRAYEVSDDSWYTDQNVTIIVNDVNDKTPLITVEPLTLTIPENTVTTLEFQIQIEDMDLGDNGTFQVFLDDTSGNNYHKAFQIVPDQGYQSWKFTISVINSALLDYEDILWQKISFQIHSKEVKDGPHSDSKTVEIFLENTNDELPMFEKEEYTEHISEDIGKDKSIATVYATDRDIDDHVTHTLIGTAINELFTINPTTGEIRTKKDNAFDYEKQTQVMIQVQAEDSLLDVHHKNITQLVISVEDVNDEPPSIIVPKKSISIKENEPKGTVVNDDKDTEIVATDEDTTSKLKFSISWEESFALKNGQPALMGYKECVTVATVNNAYGDYAKAVLLVEEVENNKTMDYELFDTLVITLVVTDLDQTLPSNTDKARITISIEDVNDNKPIFNSDSIISYKSVVEHAPIETIIGTISATDADGPKNNIVTYSIRPADDGTPDNWVAIKPDRGELYVNVNEEIDADIPIWYLNYTVIASDGELETEAKISIYVIDTNNQSPEINCEDCEPFRKVITIYEKSDNNSDVQLISVKDADRDEAFHKPWFRFTSSISDDVRSFFSIETFTGRVYVHEKEDKKLDRDSGISNFTISIIISDNYESIGGGQKILEVSFTVILLDKNDNPPIIQEEPSLNPISENLKKGETIGIVKAIDVDELQTINTKTDFKIKDIEMGAGAIKIPPKDLFSISTDKEYAYGIGTLIANYDLRDYYGTYNVEIQTNDFGLYPQQQEVTKTIAVHVEKYNYNPPEIIYPEDGEEIYLSKNQRPNEPLIKYDGDVLENFKAKDWQTEKWNIIFTINPDSDPKSIFKFVQEGKSQARLELAVEPDYDSAYELKIIADCQCTSGLKPYTDSAIIHIRFINIDSQPYFNKGEVTEEFKENSTAVGSFVELPKAHFNKEGEDWEIFKVYYDIREDSSGCFKIGEETAILTLVKELDREEKPSHTLKIVASRTLGGNSNPDEKSILSVFIKVLDVNDNPPNFDNTTYYAGIKPSDRLDQVIRTISATDLDINDTMRFEYHEESLKPLGEEIQNIKHPFYITTKDANSINIHLNFSVRSSMSGYFLFDISVTDEENSSDLAEVKIYIISESTVTTFKFENNVKDVALKENEIKIILEEEFPYICNIDAIQAGANEIGEIVNTATDVIMHFIDPIKNEPIDGAEMELLASSIETFPRLKAEFLRNGLYLLSFSDPSPKANMEKLLRAWLIGVSIALGALCIILIIALVLKTRSLTQRLDKLTTTKFEPQESGFDRVGMAAPNTNKHAIEGSNPVYNEEKKMPDIDTTSIGSGDSDLIGIEDNPNFHYKSESYS